MSKNKIDKLNIGKDIINDYKNGKSCSLISKKYPVSSGTISTYLKKNGIDVVNQQNSQKGLDKNIFSNINTEEKAYWLGFLYADGYVASDSNRVSLTLKESDKKHLDKFNNFLGGNFKITYRKKLKAYRLSFRCKQIKKDLVRLGCVPNKTWKINSIPNIPENLKIHFIRGFFDGDGCITFGNTNKKDERSLVINITSNEEMLKSICKYFNESRNFTKKKNTDILMVRWSGKKASKLLIKMYENSNIYLDRKFIRYKIFKQNGFAARVSDFPSY